MNNLIYLDVETTGLDPRKNDIIQIACIPVINGVKMGSFNEFCQPINWENIEQEAVNVHGITEAKMRTFQSPIDLADKLIAFARKFNVKFTIAGYNANFDKSFVGSLFNKIGKSAEYREIFSSDVHDVFRRAKAVKDQLNISSLKLGKVCSALGIELNNAHDAFFDIEATIEVDKRLAVMLNDAGISVVYNDIVDVSLPEIPHLHLHSEYSYRDSVSTVEDWIKWASTSNVPAIAFPDHDLATSLFKTILTNGVNKHVVDVCKKNKLSNTDVTIVPAVSFLLRVSDTFTPRINAWAVSEIGYRNLIKLASSGFSTKIDIDDKVSLPVLTIEELIDRSNGVVFGTGCDRGLFSKGFETNSYDIVESVIEKLKAYNVSLVAELLPYDVNAIFDDKAGFKGIAKSPAFPEGNVTHTINNVAVSFIDKHQIPFIVSTAAHFIDVKDKVIQDVVSKSSYKDGRYFYESRHQRTSSECFVILSRHLGSWMSLDRFNEAAKNALSIVALAKQINIEYEYHLPKIEIPQNIVEKTSDYDKQLYYLTLSKIMGHGRWSDAPEYVERFKKELDVIWKNKKINFIPYFLMYEDISAYAREQGILEGIARGSAGGSLISYYLKITHIDPIKENLPFERFLSHARINAGSFPDIDKDFGERGPILKYAHTKYGVGFAQIGTLQTFKTKNAIKDTMYAIYGRNRADREIMDICDTIPDSPQGLNERDFLYGYTDSEDIYHKGHLEDNEILRNFFDQYPELTEIIQKLIGLIRGLSRHASGFVLSTLDLSSSRVPLTYIEDDDVGLMPVTQYEAPMVEKIGLIKADILGVTTIKTIAECVNLIKRRTNENFLEEDDKGVAYIYRLPEDSGVYEDFYFKKTDSSFQFNTDLIKGFITDFAPVERSDLSAITALCRPGALDVTVLPGVSATQYYLDIRNGARDVEYIHPDLESILKKTNGVVVYQEQLMQILVQFCGYSLEESDQIRSAIAKKKREVMVKAFERVRIETAKIGWTPDQAEKLCDVLTAYSNYSFNLSHSRAYSELGYITMYLKHHYPLEWWCAELNQSNEEKIRHYVTILGSKIMPPTLKNPSDRFIIVGDKIAAPLTTIKGLGPSSIKEIVSKGPYSSLEDFVSRVSQGKVNSGHFGALIRGRVTDCIMDKELPYHEARLKLMKDYVQLRGSSPFAADLNDVDPVSIFMMERSTNKCFNKTLLSESALFPILKKGWRALKETNKKSVPFFMGTVPVIGSVKAADVILEKEDEIEVGFIGLFQSSSFKSGISKKSGKQWNKTTVMVSDGVIDIECTWWDHMKALRLPVNSIVYIRGKLKRGWKDMPMIGILEVQKIGEIK
jgi:DNA polymerase-3 subunit alpha